MKWFVFCTLAFFGLAEMQNLAAADATVQLLKKDSTIQVNIGGQEFTVLQFSDEYMKPFFAPVHAPNGEIITRSLEGIEDHPHHKGIWLSLDEVNGLNFWGEEAKIQNAGVEVVVAEGNPAQLRLTNNWLGTDGKPLLVEQTNVKIYNSRMITYDTTLKAVVEKVEFADTKEGMFGIRLRDGMREKEEGQVINSQGAKTTANCWGKTADWVDYFGPVEGKTVGVALFDHPNNFRPSRYHVRNYGLFTINPFGEGIYTDGANAAAPVTLMQGNSIRLRYGLYVHNGDTTEGNVSQAYRQYLGLAD
ncbi:hypothetical protein Pla110_28340 [Polystyrenella longa]|uniref:Methane oxygenase PmoA n=1 Tax=Polystyrenella longa TaxID=2528007 RepID=A0A518CPD2_9PLAN|nr:PmoA family protein [Polystyrenella longa]QDU81097.1 hypothetical protein Pla110_28340 [Polystyrenella longa]